MSFVYFVIYNAQIVSVCDSSNTCVQTVSVKKPAAAATAAPSTGHSVHPAQGESSQCSDLSGYKNTASPNSASQRLPMVPSSALPLLPHGFLPSDPGLWNIEDVYEFISSLPGGSHDHIYQH